MKMNDYESLKEVWMMKDNAYKVFISSGKDYIDYLNETTKDFIIKYNIRYRKDILSKDKVS